MELFLWEKNYQRKKERKKIEAERKLKNLGLKKIIRAKEWKKQNKVWNIDKCKEEKRIKI